MRDKMFENLSSRGKNAVSMILFIAMVAVMMLVTVCAPPADDTNGSSNGGATWTTNKLTAYDGAAGEWFGYSVAISADGNTVIVGAYKDDDNGSNSGSAYWLHTADGGTTWTTNKLIAYDGAADDYFGWSVAISDDGNTVIVGAYCDNDNGSWSGSAYWLYTADGGTTWTTNKLTAYDGAADDYFGGSVAMSADGNTVIVGAWGDDDNGSGSGSAYWLHTADNGSTWTTNKLTAYDGAADDEFGYSVAISADGNTVIVGAAWDDDNGTDSGSAYWLHTADGGTNWTTNKLTAYDGADGDKFGCSVAISDDGNTVIVGAVFDDDNGSYSGSAYWLHTADGGNTWTTNKVTAYDGAADDYFGGSVAISDDGNTVIVGAERDDDNGMNSGSAYWFDK